MDSELIVIEIESAQAQADLKIATPPSGEAATAILANIILIDASGRA